MEQDGDTVEQKLTLIALLGLEDPVRPEVPGAVQVCCSVLQCAAVCCSVLQCVASTLQHGRPELPDAVQVCCSVWQCSAVCFVAPKCQVPYRCVCTSLLYVSCRMLVSFVGLFRMLVSFVGLFCSQRSSPFWEAVQVCL